MSIYEQIESAAITALDILTDYVVAAMPENDAAYKRAQPTPRVWVSLGNSIHYGEPNTQEKNRLRSLQFVMQDEHIYLDLLISARTLRGDLGVFQVWEDVRDALLGVSLVDCQPLYLLEFGQAERSEGAFMYLARFKCIRNVVQNYSEASAPTLNELKFNTL